MGAFGIKRFYDLAFWAAVAGVGYYLYGFVLYRVRPTMAEAVGPYADIIIGLVVLATLFVLNYIKEAIAYTVRAIVMRLTSDAPVSFEGPKYESSLQKSAHKLERRGDLLGAAEVYESLHAWREAARVFEQAGYLSRAASAWEKAGEVGKAIDLYESDKQYEVAANKAVTEGLRERATRNFHLAGEKAYEDNAFAKAAQFFEKALEFERAGGIYETLKRDNDALRCYERSGASGKIEILLKRVQPSDSANLVTGKASFDIVRRSAEVLAREGKLINAAEALESAGDNVRAAEVYDMAKEFEKAGEAYLRADMVDKAEACYNKVTDKTKVADFYARIAIQRGDYKGAGNAFLDAGKSAQAVEAFKKAKDFAAAARVYESMKRYLLAAEMYSTARDLRSAGEAYAKGHDWRNAAECFEACDETGKAIECHVSAGNFFRAGMLCVKLGDPTKAVEYLQRVPPTSPDWKLATGYLAAAFYYQGRVAMAEELFAKVVEQMVPNQDNLAVLYAYGRMLEDQRNVNVLAVYRRILGVAANYEDIQQRIERIEQNMHTYTSANTRPPTQVTGFTQQQMPTVQQQDTFDKVFSQPTVMTQVPTQTQSSGHRQITQLPETRFGDEGRYQIIHELGRGGMAIVYKAFDLHLEREVALKTFPLSRHSGPGKEEVFLREARLIARLQHPNIVTIYDCGHMNYLYYLAMEYVPGENLKQLVKRRGPMSLEEVKSVLQQLGEALEYAHGLNVLHQDIKPGNIILRTSNDIKVVDFGLSKLVSDAATHMPLDNDDQQTLVMTPHYMAPEQILGEQVDRRTDIYSLGLTLFFLLTGKTPFDVKKITDLTEVSRMQIQSSFPVPSMLRATLPPKLDLIFVKCTQKNPAERYQSIVELMNDFARV